MDYRDKFQYLRDGHWISSANGVRECPRKVNRDYGWGCTVVTFFIILLVSIIILNMH